MNPRRKILSERQTRRLAQAKIDGGEWFTYNNVPLSLIVHIKRALISTYATAAKVSEFDAVPAIASLVCEHGPRLDRFDIGQSEALLSKPLKATWHVLVKDDEYWISDEEFWPYF